MGAALRLRTTSTREGRARKSPAASADTLAARQIEQVRRASMVQGVEGVPGVWVDAFFDLADTIITLRSLVRRAWTIHHWDTRPVRRS